MQKRGISPLIATVLIIGFVIVLAALVMQWGSGLFEKIMAESDIESQKALACSRINLNIINAKTDFFNSKAEVSVESLSEQSINGFVVRLSGENGIDGVEVEDELKFGELKKINIPRFNIVKTGLVKTVEVFPKIMIENKYFVCENKISKNVLNYDPHENGIEKIWKVWDDVDVDAIIGTLDNNNYSGTYSLKTHGFTLNSLSNLNIFNQELNEANGIFFSFLSNAHCYPQIQITPFSQRTGAIDGSTPSCGGGYGFKYLLNFYPNNPGKWGGISVPPEIKDCALNVFYPINKISSIKLISWGGGCNTGNNYMNLDSFYFYKVKK